MNFFKFPRRLYPNRDLTYPESSIPGADIFYLSGKIVVHIISALSVPVAFANCGKHTAIIDSVAGNYILAFFFIFRFTQSRLDEESVAHHNFGCTAWSGNGIINNQCLGIDMLCVQFKTKDVLRLVNIEHH